MTGFKTFAVIGAGNIGGPIVSALLAARAAGTVSRALVLTRNDSNTSIPEGAEVVQVDYTSHSSLTQALVGIDVVISTISFYAFHIQPTVARAAKEAGVKLFVPSEFGLAADQEVDTDESRAFIEAKQTADKAIRDILPVATFYTGSFADWMWLPRLNLDLASGKVIVGGDGNAMMALTSRDDIGRFVTHVLTSLSPTELENRIFRIQGDYRSFNEIFHAYEQKHRIRLDVTYVPIKELKKKVKENPHDIVSVLHLLFAQGHSVVGEPLDNDIWPEWKPKKVFEYL